MPKKLHILVLACLAATLVVSACAPQTSTPSATASTETAQPTQAAPPTAIPQPTATPRPPALWIDPSLPDDFRAQVAVDAGMLTTTDASAADFLLTTSDALPVSQWVYALAAPFPTIPDDLPAAALLQVWLGEVDEQSPFERLVVDASTAAVFEAQWGAPSRQTVDVVSTEAISDQCWNTPGSWALLPFESVDHTWKIISLDGQSPLRKSFDPNQYALTISISLVNQGTSSIQPADLISLPATNRDPAKLTTVILTGVTALVRATAQMMELKGMAYPATDIGADLREADILHINNEIPFAENCPPPFPREDNLVFCSKEKYIQLLEDIGTDVVELSGDHFQDWGPKATLFTLDLYRQRGWGYYGGGENLADGRKPLLMEHNGNRIAFLGCNAKARGYATASETQPGAVFCDFDLLTSQIKELRQQGYLPIVTFQHLEYYDYKINPYLQPDFQRVAEAGAVIVSGSQAHQPHAFEFFNGAFLHYGLGNLFFDQLKEGIPTQQAFIDRHVFYDGKYINTELLTTRFVDYARSRPMTAEERSELLDTIFRLSQWNRP